MESAGLYNQNLLLTNVNSRLTPKISLFGTLFVGLCAQQHRRTEYLSGKSVQHGGRVWPGANDIRNRASLGGSITSKLGLLWNPFDHSAIRRAVQHHHQPGYL